MIIENILSQYSQSLSFIIEIIYQFTYKQHPVFYMRLTCNQHSSWPGPVAAVESLDRAVSRSVAPLEALGARREPREAQLAAPLRPSPLRPSPRRARLAAETATEELPSCGNRHGICICYGLHFSKEVQKSNFRQYGQMEKQRWEAPERRSQEVRRAEKRKSEKKEDAGAQKGRKVSSVPATKLSLIITCFKCCACHEI